MVADSHPRRRNNDNNMQTDTTFRLVVVGDAEYRGRFGQTAPDPSLAKLVAGDLVNIDRSRYRLGMERTDWVGHPGKMKIHRSVVVDAETWHARPRGGAHALPHGSRASRTATH